MKTNRTASIVLALRAMLRNVDTASVSMITHAPDTSRALCTLTVYSRKRANHYATTESGTASIAGYIAQGYTDVTKNVDGSYPFYPYPKYVEAFAPTRGVWTLSCGGAKSLRDIVAVLPTDATIRIEARLDCLTTSVLTEAKLHGDALVLTALWTRGKKLIEREYVIDTRTGRHNAGRFGSWHEMQQVG